MGSSARRAGAGDDGVVRRRRLQRLLDAVVSLRRAMGAATAELRRLHEAELARPLGPEEVRRVRVLRLQSEGYRLELQCLHAEYEQVRAGAIAPAHGPPLRPAPDTRSSRSTGVPG